jgi:hypothetical protein
MVKYRFKVNLKIKIDLNEISIKKVHMIKSLYFRNAEIEKIEKVSHQIIIKDQSQFNFIHAMD